MIEKIDNFVHTMLEQQNQFETIQNTISRCEADVEKEIRKLEEREKRLVSESKLNMSGLNEPEIMEVFEKASESLMNVIADANNKICEAVKGMTFIQDFEKHFTVAVFGKVKAGKSYIGNFVMGNAIKKTGAYTKYSTLNPITVHVYDRGNLSTQSALNEQSEDGDFATGMKETTSTIQWFDLGGMSWFDTPGIGSVTWENEMLAKEYVKNADLVIFACNSDAAGTRQEFAEMKQLYDMGKPILLLLTQSDTYDMDVDDEGEEISILVPKTEKDRNDTEEYMIQTLNEQGMSDLLKYDILTVSAKLALVSLKNRDEELFEQSHMGEFLDKLVEITRNDAAEIKKATPKKRLNKMIDGIIVDLENMSEQIGAACQSIEGSRRDLESRKDSILEQIKAKVYLEMLKIIQNNKLKVEKDRVVVTEDQISKEMNLAISECIRQVCKDEAIKSTDMIKDMDIKLTGVGDMQMKQDSIQYEYVSVYQVQRPPSGVFEKIGAKFFKKEYYTSKSRTEIKSSHFDIGVNDTEMAQNIMLKLDDVFRTGISAYIECLVDGYYKPIEELQNKSVLEISNTIHTLQALKI